ncbi:transcription factor E2F6-like [Sciurus carolinensis]|uniref:transcription factor E2F6-like n=1 Tax=Sciurus carolinensis TaxID=30640 RepID=UPI001FB3EB00|nr:transcription factor E2F6-like [Sciurus carolinensis]
MDPTAKGVRWPSKVQSLPPSKIGMNAEGSAQNVSGIKAPEGKRTRFHVSLVGLTQKFVDLITSTPGGVLDLNKAAAKLGVPKRRLYDITSVLNGIDFVEKKSKNHVQWIGSDLNNSEASAQRKKLQEELSDLSAMEDALDELIKDCSQQLYELTDDKTNESLAYVTCQDVHSIQDFREQIVIAIKAPEETTLDVAAPREDCLEVHVRSTKGPIDVYLCEMEQNHSNEETFDGVGTSSSESKHPDCPEKGENSPQQSEDSPEENNI